jgi:hypothetical protein
LLISEIIGSEFLGGEDIFMHQVWMPDGLKEGPDDYEANFIIVLTFLNFGS